MTVPDVTFGPFAWTCIVVASFLILACVVAVPMGRAVRRADEADRAAQPEHVNWLPYLPPVPPPITQADIDATWLDAWPTAASDTGEIRLRFDQIVAAEEWAA